MFFLSVCAHKCLFHSTSPPVAGSFVLWAILLAFLLRGYWCGAMILVCHLVIRLFPCHISLIRTLSAIILAPFATVTWIAGNLQHLSCTQSVQGGSHCTTFPCLLQLSISFLSSFFCGIYLLSDAGKKTGADHLLMCWLQLADHPWPSSNIFEQHEN